MGHVILILFFSVAFPVYLVMQGMYMCSAVLGGYWLLCVLVVWFLECTSQTNRWGIPSELLGKCWGIPSALALLAVQVLLGQSVRHVPTCHQDAKGVSGFNCLRSCVAQRLAWSSHARKVYAMCQRKGLWSYRGWLVSYITAIVAKSVFNGTVVPPWPHWAVFCSSLPC